MDRIQRTRQAPLPPHTLCVTRPGKYGNPYKITRWGKRWKVNWEFGVVFDTQKEAHLFAVLKFLELITADRAWRDEFTRECAEKQIEHLACWCKPNEICHADIWLAVWRNFERRFKVERT